MKCNSLFGGEGGETDPKLPLYIKNSVAKGYMSGNDRFARYGKNAILMEATP